MELWFAKHGHGMLPFSDETEEFIKKLKLGAVITASFRQVRNPLFHRKFWALVKVAHDMASGDRFQTVVETNQGPMPVHRPMAETKRWLIKKAGYIRWIAYPDGSVEAVPESIAFSNMSQERFERLYSDVIDVILLELMNGEESRQELERVLSFV